MVLIGSCPWRVGGNGDNKETVVETRRSLEATSLMSVACSLQEASGELHIPSWQDESLTGKNNLKTNTTKFSSNKSR